MVSLLNALLLRLRWGSTDLYCISILASFRRIKIRRFRKFPRPARYRAGRHSTNADVHNAMRWILVSPWRARISIAKVSDRACCSPRCRMSASSCGATESDAILLEPRLSHGRTPCDREQRIEDRHQRCEPPKRAPSGGNHKILAYPMVANMDAYGHISP